MSNVLPLTAEKSFVIIVQMDTKPNIGLYWIFTEMKQLYLH